MSEAFEKEIGKVGRRRTKSTVSGTKHPEDMSGAKPLSSRKFPHHSTYGTNKSSTKPQSSNGLNAHQQNEVYQPHASNLAFAFRNIDDDKSAHQRNEFYQRVPQLVSRDRFLHRKHLRIQEQKRKLHYPEFNNLQLHSHKNPQSNSSYFQRKSQSLHQAEQYDFFSPDLSSSQCLEVDKKNDKQLFNVETLKEKSNRKSLIQEKNERKRHQKWLEMNLILTRNQLSKVEHQAVTFKSMYEKLKLKNARNIDTIRDQQGEIIQLRELLSLSNKKFEAVFYKMLKQQKKESKVHQNDQPLSKKPLFM